MEVTKTFGSQKDWNEKKMEIWQTVDEECGLNEIETKENDVEVEVKLGKQPGLLNKSLAIERFHIPLEKSGEIHGRCQ
jgi:hypothetical protein